MQVDPFPCGACGTLVGFDEGCPHWKPAGRKPNTTGRKPSMNIERRRRVAELSSELVRALGYPKP